MQPIIAIRNVCLYNLKNICLDIHKNQFVVITGLSGSGKSMLAFDILLVTDGLTKPPMDSITSLPPRSV